MRIRDLTPATAAPPGQQADPGKGLEIKVPPLPTTFAEVVQLYKADAEPQSEALIEIVERDTAMAAYVLRHANSAYYGLRSNISQIERAITVLGFMPVCNLVLSASLKKAFQQLDSPGVRGIYAHVMKSSMASAAFARDLAVHLELKYPDTTFAAALLHQLGRLVLLFSASKRYPALWYNEEGVLATPLAATEREALRLDYVDAGIDIAQRWRFPDELTTAIRYHARPQALKNAHLSTLCFIVSSAHFAATSLYAPGNRPSAFFGLSAPLAEFARQRGLVARELITVFATRREAVRELAESIMAA